MQEKEYRSYLDNIALTKDSPYFSPDTYIPGADKILLETIERCKNCSKNFLSRYGRIRRCSDHKNLEVFKTGPIKLPVVTKERSKLF